MKFFMLFACKLYISSFRTLSLGKMKAYDEFMLLTFDQPFPYLISSHPSMMDRTGKKALKAATQDLKNAINRDAESLSFWVEFDSEFTTFLIRISEFDSEFTTLLTKISEFDSEFMRFVKSEFEFDSEFSEICRIQRVGARFRIPLVQYLKQINGLFGKKFLTS